MSKTSSIIHSAFSIKHQLVTGRRTPGHSIYRVINTGVIRPVLEYAAPVWNHLLSETQIDQIEAIPRRALIGSSTVTLMICLLFNALYCASTPSLVDRRKQLSRKFFTSILEITLILSSYPFTYSSGSYNYNSIKICKQISTPPQPYQKIPDIYFSCSCSLPNFTSILSPITIIYDVIIWVQDGNCKKWLERILILCVVQYNQK